MDKLALMRQGLDEARSMLDEMRDEAIASDLQVRLSRLEQRLGRWAIKPPTRLERAATINDVVNLKMDVAKARMARTSAVIARGAIASEPALLATKARGS